MGQRDEGENWENVNCKSTGNGIDGNFLNMKKKKKKVCETQVPSAKDGADGANGVILLNIF